MCIRKSIAAIAISLLAFGCVQAKRRAAMCSPAQAQAADAAVDTLTSWDALRDFYKKFRRCDDGDIAEGSSEAVARLFVDKWDELPQLVKLTAGDTTFRSYVLRHINTTLNTDDLVKIAESAKEKCPVGISSFCGRIHTAAVNASK
jgi:hypothetical protein